LFPVTATVLAIDTATEACSAALHCGGAVRRRFEIAPRRHNTLIFEMCESLFEETGAGLGDLDAIVFGRGPGAFTGVRIAASFAQGVGYGRGLPVVPVSDLRAVAQAAMERHNAASALVTMDARMGEVYYGCFRRGEDGLAAPAGDEGVAPPEQVPVAAGFRGICAGSAWRVHRDALNKALGNALEKAQAMAPGAAPERALEGASGTTPERALEGVPGGAARICDEDLLPDAAVMLQLALPVIIAGDANAIVEAANALPIYLRSPV